MRAGIASDADFRYNSSGMFCITPRTRIVALDLETTGLSAVRDRIVELAAVCWQNGCEDGHFQTLVNPGRWIPPSVIRIHGITDAMVSDKPCIADVLPAFLDFCRADLLVGHNIQFDLRFLQAECERQGIIFTASPVIDTRTLAKQHLPTCPNYRLETIKTVLGIGNHQSHRALDDARDCLAVFLRLLRGEVTPLHAPITARARANGDNTDLVLVCEMIESGETVMIEYEDIRGQMTHREIKPLAADGVTVEAFCLLRNDRRRFAIERIKRVWKP